MKEPRRRHIIVKTKELEEQFKSVKWYAHWESNHVSTATTESIESDLMGYGSPNGRDTAGLCKLAFVYYLETSRLLPGVQKYIAKNNPGFIDPHGVTIGKDGHYYVSETSALGKLLIMVAKAAEELSTDE